MNEFQYQRLLELFEPLVDWDEEILRLDAFRETPRCIHYLLFRLWAPVWTRHYYVALTDKRVVILPIPRSGYIEFQQHFFVNYIDVTLDDYDEKLIIDVLEPKKSLSLKFFFFQKQKSKDEFITTLIDRKKKNDLLLD